MTHTSPRPIELLAPARDAEVAIQAILHGADAVYMGASSHGARKEAANNLDDIRKVVEFAHVFRVRVYVTVNTIVYEHEIADVEALVRRLWEIGVDAIIVQDMGILRMDIPPIELHASTQCDISSPEKARFLQEMGFSQLVAARELTLEEIGEMCRAVTIPVECFVHGALCVSYSGRCHASYACKGRSANRGECAQICRLPYTLTDADGRVIAKDKYLLSLHDFNASDRIADLLRAGVSSFKIEGRLKDAGYVKNVTAAYRRIIDNEISRYPDLYCRGSFGISDITFTPKLDKSFNRGFTHYFLDGQRPLNIASLCTNKSLGEEISDLSMLRNGDGISWFDKDGIYTGRLVNDASDRSLERLSRHSTIHRTSDVVFDKVLAKPSADRKLTVDIEIDNSGVSARDERGVEIRVQLPPSVGEANKPMNPKAIFAKLGNTEFVLRNFSNHLDSKYFLPASKMTEVRRNLVEILRKAAESTYPFRLRRTEITECPYISKSLDYRDNVANSLAHKFYNEHGVDTIEPALETKKNSNITRGTTLMTCRHCILRELGKCLKEHPGKVKLPLTITSGSNKMGLRFDCDKCRMMVVKI